ncbi:MAG: hypothetical protein MUE81_19045 [Thermoflexibacter sp.]|nr:hypothetical protein [Thermoflexibacter sp.]
MNQCFKSYTIIIFCLGLVLPMQAQVKPFAPEIFKDKDVFGLTVSPDGKEIFFVKSWGGRDSLAIFHAKKTTDNQWTEPVKASFSNQRNEFKDIDPIFSPDGRTLLFNSTRPKPQNPDNKDFDIWMVKQKPDKTWSNAIHLGEIVNSDSSDFYASVANNGNLYFSSSRAGKFGKIDIYKSEFKNGTYQIPVNLGQTINDGNVRSNPFIAPDESYLIFYGFDEGSFGDSDLYISFNEEGMWTKPVNLGSLVNSTIGEFCPSVSADGKYLYFSRLKKGGAKLEQSPFFLPFKHLKIKQLKKKNQ